MKLSIHCRNCASVFQGWPKHGKPPIFCSRVCAFAYRQSHRTTKTVARNGYRRVVWEIQCIRCSQKKDAVRKTAKYCSNACMMQYEYEHGLRDKTKIAQAAHAAVRATGFPSRRGKPIPHLRDPEVWAKVSKTKTGRPVPNLRGPRSGNWRGGVNKDIWHSWEYQAWRKAVFRRDKYTCVLCGDARGGNLEADHIKPRLLYPELTLDVNNGRTLCKTCHRETITWGHNTKVLYNFRIAFSVALLYSELIR